MDRCRKLELGILASKSEHLPDGGAQLSLDVLSMVLGDRQRAELEAALAAANEEQQIPAKLTNASKKRIEDWQLEVELPTPLFNAAGVVHTAKVEKRSN